MQYCQILHNYNTIQYNAICLNIVESTLASPSPSLPDELSPLRVCSDVLVIKVIESAEAPLEREDEEVRVAGENGCSKVVGESDHGLVRLEIRHAVKDRKILQRAQKRFES